MSLPDLRPELFGIPVEEFRGHSYGSSMPWNFFGWSSHNALVASRHCATIWRKALWHNRMSDCSQDWLAQTRISLGGVARALDRCRFGDGITGRQ